MDQYIKFKSRLFFPLRRMFCQFITRKQYIGEKTFDHTLLHNNDVGYFYINTDGEFQEVNDAWLRMHGFSSSGEVIGRHFSITQIEKDRKAAQKIVDELLIETAFISGLFSHKCRNKSIGYHSFAMFPVEKNGEIIGIEGVLVNIPTRRNRSKGKYNIQSGTSLGTTARTELTGIISTCMCCHKVNDGQGHWIPLDEFVHRQWNIQYSHGIYIDCIGTCQ